MMRTMRRSEIGSRCAMATTDCAPRDPPGFVLSDAIETRWMNDEECLLAGLTPSPAMVVTSANGVVLKSVSPGFLSPIPRGFLC